MPAGKQYARSLTRQKRKSTSDHLRLLKTERNPEKQRAAASLFAKSSTTGSRGQLESVKSSKAVERTLELNDAVIFAWACWAWRRLVVPAGLGRELRDGARAAAATSASPVSFESENQRSVGSKLANAKIVKLF